MTSCSAIKAGEQVCQGFKTVLLKLFFLQMFCQLLLKQRKALLWLLLYVSPYGAQATEFACYGLTVLGTPVISQLSISFFILIAWKNFWCCCSRSSAQWLSWYGRGYYFGSCSFFCLSVILCLFAKFLLCLLGEDVFIWCLLVSNIYILRYFILLPF